AHHASGRHHGRPVGAAAARDGVRARFDAGAAPRRWTVSRRMSCSMTVDAVRARTKTVTRRHVDTWKELKPGDRLTLIEKGMGLPKGAKQVVLAEVEIVDVRVEPIIRIVRGYGPDEMVAEGFPPDT